MSAVDRHSKSGQPEAGIGAESSRLAQSTGWRLATAGRFIRGEAERALETLGLRNRHFGVLLILAATGSAAQGEVARQALMDKSTMVAVVDDLEEQGLVERRRNPANRRSYELVLTTAGAATLEEARSRVAAVEQRFLAPLDDEDRQQLHETLGRLLLDAGLT